MDTFFTIFLLLLALGALVFWAWMLNDCIMYEPYGAAKAIWIIVISFTGWLGAGIYFLFWRPERRKMLASRIEERSGIASQDQLEVNQELSEPQ